MKHNKAYNVLRVAALLLALALPFCALAAAADESEDPLISYSYVEEVLKPQLKAELKAELREELLRELADLYGTAPTPGEADGYDDITAPCGSIIKPGEGCEVILRAGSAVVITASSGETFGLLDLSDNSSCCSGSQVQTGHVYSCREDSYILISEGTAFLTMRGDYEIN